MIMEQKCDDRDMERSRVSSRAGFSLLNVLVATAMLTGSMLLVTNVAKQSNKLKQGATVNETILSLSQIAASASRNPQMFLAQLRGSIHTGAIYAACIPDGSVANPRFNCPPVRQSITIRDAELARMAGSSFHVTSTNLVDTVGRKVTGSDDAPHYLESDGSPCARGAAECPLMATGYFMRTNQLTSGDPGNIKFVFKLSQNPAFQAVTTPFRARYAQVDLGKEWKVVPDSLNGIPSACPTGSVRMGYLSNGMPNCVNDSMNCPSGQISLGLDASGQAQCKPIPSCGNNESVVIDSGTNDLVCQNSSPCDKAIFLGYDAGTGDPICKAVNTECGKGKLQVGLKTESDGSFKAECIDFPTCGVNEYLKLVNKKFQCDDRPTDPKPTRLTCSQEQEMYGFDEIGNVLCRDRPEIARCEAPAPPTRTVKIWKPTNERGTYSLNSVFSAGGPPLQNPCPHNQHACTRGGFRNLQLTCSGQTSDEALTMMAQNTDTGGALCTKPVGSKCNAVTTGSGTVLNGTYRVWECVEVEVAQ